MGLRSSDRSTSASRWTRAACAVVVVLQKNARNANKTSREYGPNALLLRPALRCFCAWKPSRRKKSMTADRGPCGRTCSESATTRNDNCVLRWRRDLYKVSRTTDDLTAALTPSRRRLVRTRFVIRVERRAVRTARCVQCSCCRRRRKAITTLNPRRRAAKTCGPSRDRRGRCRLIWIRPSRPRIPRAVWRIIWPVL